jgi:ABC-2 type transport system permease protein
MFDLLYLPLRATVFLVAVGLAFGLHLEGSGALPTAALLLAFLPFVWGLGVFGAALVLTFRRGGGVVTLVTTALALLSGAYFPLELLPRWAESAAAANPIALVITGSRDALLGGTGWRGVPEAVGFLVLAGAASLTLGVTAFRAALARERRRGTVGQF